MTDSQKQIIDSFGIDKLREYISIWTTQGYYHLVVYAEERLEKLTIEHSAVIPVEECTYE